MAPAVAVRHSGGHRACIDAEKEGKKLTGCN